MILRLNSLVIDLYPDLTVRNPRVSLGVGRFPYPDFNLKSTLSEVLTGPCLQEVRSRLDQAIMDVLCECVLGSSYVATVPRVP